MFFILTRRNLRIRLARSWVNYFCRVRQVILMIEMSKQSFRGQLYTSNRNIFSRFAGARAAIMCSFGGRGGSNELSHVQIGPRSSNISRNVTFIIRVYFKIIKFSVIWNQAIFTMISILNFFICSSGQIFIKTKRL